MGNFDGQTVSFGGDGDAGHAAVVDVESGANGATATIPDAHLLFNADFARTGNDLVLNGHDGDRAIVRDYFSADERVTLLSPEGARLSHDLVDALTGSAAPDQYAQATPPAPAANDAVGRVVTAAGDATILRNGVAVTLRPGDAVLRADVLQTTNGTMAVTFNDGSTLNLTANTRIVVSEFVYSPNGNGNSQLLDLVQGSLTFISGEVAHSGNMRIGTPVATMGIRGTVGGVTTASDGTVQFYVSQSATGAVVIDSAGRVIAQVVQDGPMIVVRPVGPLQIVADEIQKSPAQLAIELQALQQIVSIKAVGDQLIQQFFQQQNPNNPNPQTPQDQPHTQIPADQKLSIAITFVDVNIGGDLGGPRGVATIQPLANIQGDPGDFKPVVVSLSPNLPPVNFGPLLATVKEDQSLVFSSARALTIFDADSPVLTVTLTAAHGLLKLSGVAGLVFSAGNGVDNTTMTFSGSAAAINAALNGMTFTPSHDYNGDASVTLTTRDDTSAGISATIAIAVTSVNDAPVLAHAPGTALSFTENGTSVAINNALTLSDVDNTTLTGAKVTISEHYHSGEDVLGFVNQHGITGVYANGVLTLSGVASVADYQAALRSVTYSNTSDNPSDDTRTISFQVNDGSAENGASNTVMANVTVAPVNDAPVLNFFNVNLDDGGPVVLSSNDYGVTDPDGPALTFTVTNVTGGEFVVDSGNNNLFFASFDIEGSGAVTFTSADIAAGRVTFVPDGSGDPVSYSISVGDGIAPPTQPIVDHLPQAEDVSATVIAGTAVASYNIVIILDTSGSMDGARLILAKQAIANLLGNDNVDINKVMAVSFSSAGHVHNGESGPWVSASEANGFFQGSIAAGGTNYADAISDVMAAWNANAPSDAAKTLVYFISDGEPTAGQGLGDVQGLTALWESFLASKSVDASYAIGISTNVNDGDLAPIAWSASDADFLPINLTSADGLDNTLQGTVVDTHNVLADSATSFGGDGGRFLSVTVDGKAYTWDGLNTVSSSSQAQWSHTAASLTVTTALGGTFTFYFGDEAGGHHAGDWTYVPPLAAVHSTEESFHYTIVDNDGDQAGANITVAVRSDVPVVDLNGESPGTNYATSAFNDDHAVAVFGVSPSIVDADSTHLFSASVSATLAGHLSYETYGSDNLFVDLSVLDGATRDPDSGISSWQGLAWEYQNGPSGLFINITGEGSLSTYEQILAAVRFATNSDNGAERVFQLAVNDGTHGSAPVTSTVSVHVDEAPTFDTTGLTTVGDEIHTLVTALAVLDGDAGSDPMSFSLSAQDGTLDFNNAGNGLTVGGSGTHTLTGTGTLSIVNTALANGIVYTSDDQQPSVSSALATINDGHGGTDTVNFVFANGTVSGPITLFGTSGKDVIFAAGFDSTLTGNGGNDAFVFQADNGGTAHITDFSVLDDFLQISHTIFATVDAVLGHAQGDGGNTVISTANQGSVVLEGVDATTFQSIDHSHIIIV
ncbi:MAG: cadherin-like domain-containing protein [Pseudolabrys sp.]